MAIVVQWRGPIHPHKSAREDPLICFVQMLWILMLYTTSVNLLQPFSVNELERFMLRKVI